MSSYGNEASKRGIRRWPAIRENQAVIIINSSSPSAKGSTKIVLPRNVERAKRLGLSRASEFHSKLSMQGLTVTLRRQKTAGMLLICSVVIQGYSDEGSHSDC
jgi:hypothetical protein